MIQEAQRNSDLLSFDEGFILSPAWRGQGGTASVPLVAAPCSEPKAESFAEGKRAERAVSLSPGHGILPISQSSFGVHRPGEAVADFPLTGSGERYGNCGSFFTVGCLNVEEHIGMNLDGVNMEGKAYIERHKQSCHRALCPICWNDWANREKDKATQRLKAFHLKDRNLKLIHLVVSVPHVDYALSLPEMREKVYRALNRVHCIGGMMLYHPKRENPDGSWYFSPHFHIVGYGWIMDVRRNYIESGYVVRNFRVRKTVEGTIFYQLSHCGISPKHHALTWFGALSYGKLHVKYEIPEDPSCPLCHARLRRLMWIGPGECPLPDIEGGVFYDDPANWMEKRRTPWIGED